MKVAPQKSPSPGRYILRRGVIATDRPRRSGKRVPVGEEKIGVVADTIAGDIQPKVRDWVGERIVGWQHQRCQLEWREKPILVFIIIRVACCGFDDQAQQGVIGIRIRPTGARGKQRWVDIVVYQVGNRPDGVQICGRGGVIGRISNDIVQAALVAQQLPQLLYQQTLQD